VSFGFTSIDVDGEARPHYLLFIKVLVADSMKLNKLKRNDERVEAECVEKTPEFFYRKLSLINRNKHLQK
jgi:hypothetical protein